MSGRRRRRPPRRSSCLTGSRWPAPCGAPPTASRPPRNVVLPRPRATSPSNDVRSIASARPPGLAAAREQVGLLFDRATTRRRGTARRSERLRLATRQRPPCRAYAAARVAAARSAARRARRPRWPSSDRMPRSSAATRSSAARRTARSSATRPTRRLVQRLRIRVARGEIAATVDEEPGAMSQDLVVFVIAVGRCSRSSGSPSVCWSHRGSGGLPSASMRTPVTGPTDDATDRGAAPPIADLSFDDALAELQRTIAELETGSLPLERTLALHERGAALLERARRCCAARSCGCASWSPRAARSRRSRSPRTARSTRPDQASASPTSRLPRNTMSGGETSDRRGTGLDCRPGRQTCDPTRSAHPACPEISAPASIKYHSECAPDVRQKPQ